MDIATLIMAGGNGSRLVEIKVDGRPLTEIVPKPLVPLAGHNGRIVAPIDFALSNVFNSGIQEVGILIQYKRDLMGEYLIDFSRNYPFEIGILEPAEGKYEGTADSVRKNMSYINGSDKTLVLSADHVYLMAMQNFAKALDHADLIIAVCPVGLEEARGQFGTVQLDLENRVVRFNEKTDPISMERGSDTALANMGIYAFDSDVLRYAFREMSEATDFGNHIIPGLLSRELKIIAYVFNGDWRDIGTKESYQKAIRDIKTGGLRIETDEIRLFAADKTGIYQRAGLDIGKLGL